LLRSIAKLGDRVSDSVVASLTQERVSGGGSIDADLVSGNAQNQSFDLGLGDDLVNPGGGFDLIRLGAGADQVAGSAVDLDGSHVADFTDEDRVVFWGVQFDLSAIIFTPGSAILDIDTDGDGQTDTTVTFEGEFSFENFEVTVVDGSTQITTRGSNVGITQDGTSTDDNISGSPGADRISGLDGNDTLAGGSGNDILLGGTGADRLDGGAGTDRAQYSSATAAVRADLQYASVNTGEAVGDVYLSIENLHGSRYNDDLPGDAQNNTLWGWDGNDILNGRAGNDVLVGGAGNDILLGGTGADRLDGGAGSDRAFFTGTAAASVDLRVTGAQNTGHGTDTLVSIEHLTSGSGNDRLIGNSAANSLISGNGNDTLNGLSGNDTLVGGNGNDRLIGGTGDDRLLGGAGNDTLYGGGGNDSLTGGAGADTFVFNTALGVGNVDRVTDFSVVDDTIRLENAVFTGLANGALTAAAFVANTKGLAGDASDRIIYETDTGNLFFDADGTGSGARVQFAVLNAGLAMTSADFFVI